MAMKDGEVFGTTQAGDAVRRFTIRGGGITANIIGLGAIVQDLRAWPGKHDRDPVADQLGCCF